MNKRGGNKKGQVWIETVIYTMIAFVMIGLVLSYAKPAIEEKQDKAILEQSTELMKKIDSTILTIGSAGNKRVLDVLIKRGEFKINSTTDSLIFEMESKNIYTEPGISIKDGSLTILTTKKSDYHLVTLNLNYANRWNITYLDEDKDKSISKSSTSYQIAISNKGNDMLNFEVT